jgi:hypothetical protein
MDSGVQLRKSIGDGTSPIGAFVVDHQDAGPRKYTANACCRARQIGAFFFGGNHHHDAATGSECFTCHELSPWMGSASDRVVVEETLTPSGRLQALACGPTRRRRRHEQGHGNGRMIQKRVKGLVRRLVLGRKKKGRDTSTKSILPGRVQRVVARLLTAAVPRNASGNNSSVR